MEHPPLPWGTKEIERIIPHRYPFLLIDKVIELSTESIVAIKNATISDPILQGHFPGNPVVPGVVMVEGLAQAAAVLGMSQINTSEILLTELSHARFRRKVIPGDTLRFEIQLLKKKRSFFWFAGKASVDGELACDVTLSAHFS